MDLAIRKNVCDLVLSYEQAVAQIEKIHAIIKDVNEEVKTSTLKSPYLFARIPNLVDTRKELKDHYWTHIIEKLELTRFASSKAMKEIEKSVSDGKMPEITVENIENFALNYTHNIEDIFKESVEEVFAFLRPRNKPVFEMVGPKVILRFALESVEKWSKTYSINYHQRQNFVSLEKVFRNLDGKGAGIAQYTSDLERAIESVRIESDGKGETEYFRFKCCKNRNLHIEFKNTALLARINQIGSKGSPAALEGAVFLGLNFLSP